MKQGKYFNKQQLIDIGIVDVDPNGEWIKTSTGRINKSYDVNNGYRQFIWRYNKTTYHVSAHKIVYLWFNESIPEDYHVDHIDHDGWNNKVDNLRVLPASLNCRLKSPKGTRIRKPSETWQIAKNKATKAWQQEHKEEYKEKHKATNKAWQKANREYYNAYMREYRKRKKLEKTENLE